MKVYTFFSLLTRAGSLGHFSMARSMDYASLNDHQKHSSQSVRLWVKACFRTTTDFYNVVNIACSVFINVIH